MAELVVKMRVKKFDSELDRFAICMKVVEWGTGGWVMKSMCEVVRDEETGDVGGVEEWATDVKLVLDKTGERDGKGVWRGSCGWVEMENETTGGEMG